MTTQDSIEIAMLVLLLISIVVNLLGENEGHVMMLMVRVILRD